MLLDKKSKTLLFVERATNDLRKGFPVIINCNGNKALVLSPETCSEKTIIALYEIGSPELVLSANRMKFLCGNSNVSALSIKKDSIRDIPSLCGLTDNKIKPENSRIANEIDEYALTLVKIAELIPSVITMKLSEGFKDDDILSIPSEYIEAYVETVSCEMTEACRTKLVLKHSIDSEIIAYRPNIGGKEHYAIIVGKEHSEIPLIRIHSSCYTGDLLDSLACDCRDQLHSAIELMYNANGGIILYMLQEGRGIGLINKLRAYTMKEKGFDTVDANEVLGFDDDARLFLPAAEILKKLKIKQIKLLTNNPRKAKGLEECGIKVIECVPHVMETNEYNERYLKTKSERLGHDMQ